MSEYGLNINIKSTTGKALTSLTNLNTRLTNIETNSVKASVGMQKLGNVDFTKISTQTKDLNETMTKISRKLNTTATAISNLKTASTGLSVINRSTSGLAIRLERLALSASGVAKGMDKIGISSDRNLKKIEMASFKANSAVRAIGEGVSHTNGKFKGLGETAGEVKKVTTTTRDLSKTMTDVNKSASNMGKTMGNSFKDMSREGKKTNKILFDMKSMVTGILQARAIHGLIIGFDNLTDSVWESYKNMELLNNSLNTLTGSQDVTNELVAFSDQMVGISGVSGVEINKSIKTFTSLGYSVDEVKHIIMGMLDAVSQTSGNMSYFEQINRAMSQIATNGKVMGEELNQGGEAMIPMKQILIETLGLTAKQASAIGNLNIESKDAIALFTNEFSQRYGGAMASMANSTQGTVNSIKSNFLLLARDMFTPFMDSMSNTLGAINGFVISIKNIFDKAGLATLFATLIPPDLHFAISNLLQGFSMLGAIIRNNIPFFAYMVSQFIQMGSIIATFVMPVLGILGKALTFVGQWMMKNAMITKILIGAFIGFKVLVGVTSILNMLSVSMANLALKMRMTMMTTVGSSQGMIVASTGIVGATRAITNSLRGLVTSFVMASKAILATPIGWLMLGGSLLFGAGLMSSINDMDKKVQDSNKNLDKLNLTGNNTKDTLDKANSTIDKTGLNAGNTADKIDDASDSMEGLADSTKKANKSVASFDEVITLTDNSALSDMANLADSLAKITEGFGDINSDFNLDIPDVSEDIGNIQEDIEEFIKWLDEPANFPTENGFSNMFTGLGTGIENLLTMLYGYVGQGINAVAGVVTSIMLLVDGELSKFVTSLGGVMNSVWLTLGFIGDRFVELGGTILQWSGEAIGHVVEWASASKEAYDGWIDGTGEAIGTFWKDNLSNWGEYFSGVLGITVSFWAENTVIWGNWISENLIAWGDWALQNVAISLAWTVESVTNWISWKASSVSIFGEWFLEQSESWGNWALESLSAIGTWVGDSLKQFGAWVTGNDELLTEMESNNTSITDNLGNIWDKHNTDRTKSTKDRNTELERLERNYLDVQTQIDKETFTAHSQNMDKYDKATQEAYSKRLQSESSAYKTYSDGMNKVESTYKDDKLDIWTTYNKERLKLDDELKVKLDARDKTWNTNWKTTNETTWGEFAKNTKESSQVFVDAFGKVWDDVDTKVTEKDKQMREGIISVWEDWHNNWVKPTNDIADTIWKGITGKNATILEDFENMFDDMLASAKEKSYEIGEAINYGTKSSRSYSGVNNGGRSKLISRISPVTTRGMNGREDSIISGGGSSSFGKGGSSNSEVLNLLKQLVDKEFVLEDNRTVVEGMTLIGDDRSLSELNDQLNILNMNNSRRGI